MPLPDPAESSEIEKKESQLSCNKLQALICYSLASVVVGWVGEIVPNPGVTSSNLVGGIYFSSS